jgi:hypothetical protein
MPYVFHDPRPQEDIDIEEDLIDADHGILDENSVPVPEDCND